MKIQKKISRKIVIKLQRIFLLNLSKILIIFQWNFKNKFQVKLQWNFLKNPSKIFIKLGIQKKCEQNCNKIAITCQTNFLK